MIPIDLSVRVASQDVPFHAGALMRDLAQQCVNLQKVRDKFPPGRMIRNRSSGG